MAILYKSGGFEIIDQIADLWQDLNRHHASVSKHFSSHFESFTFQTRISSLQEKSRRNGVWIGVAIDSEANLKTGYCISSIDANNHGEIDSIYVKPEYRNRGIAGELMHRAMEWLADRQAKEISIGVVHGNESAHGFYARFGFFPKVAILMKKS